MIAKGGAAIRTEVCVLGGGPAGAVLACRLARLGHDVHLLDRAPGRQRRIGETLPAPILPILDALGLGACAEAAAYRRSDGALLLWSRRDGLGSWLAKPALSIDRRQFDAALLGAARAAGARVHGPCRAGTPVRGRGWNLPVEIAGARRTIQARVLVDARGRCGRLEGRSRATSARTLALSATSRHLPATGPDSCIEACADAWSWGMALADGRYAITAFVDADACRGVGLSVAAVHRRVLSESSLFGRCLDALDGPVAVCDASSAAHVRPIGPDFVRIGEAAFAVDPLSSQGVQLAITSALQAAAAVHTMLAMPIETEAALAFYRERQQEAAARSRRIAGSLYAAQDRQPPCTFWQRRALSDAGAPGMAVESLPLLHLTDLVRLAADAGITRTPVLAGDLIRRAPALSHPSLERPLAYLGGTAIAPLLAPLMSGVEVAQLLRWWQRSVRAETARDILLWLAARAIVVPAGPRAPTISERIGAGARTARSLNRARRPGTAASPGSACP